MTFAKAIERTERQLIKSFGEVVRYTPQGGTAVDVRVIWDDSYVEQSLVEDTFVQTTSPACSLNNADIDGDTIGTEGDKIRRGGVDYYVTKVMKSGGLVTLKLSKDETSQAE